MDIQTDMNGNQIIIIVALIVIALISLLVYSVVICSPSMCEMNFGFDVDFNNDYFSSETNGLVTSFNINNMGVKAPCDSRLFGSLTNITDKYGVI